VTDSDFFPPRLHSSGFFCTHVEVAEGLFPPRFRRIFWPQHGDDAVAMVTMGFLPWFGLWENAD
jgi:hypothetical protein